MTYSIYVLYDHWIRLSHSMMKGKKKKVEKWRPEMTSTWFSQSVCTISPFCLKTLSLSSFTKSVHSKSYRALTIRELQSSLWFSLSFPILIVTCAVRPFRAHIRTRWEWGNSKLCGIFLPFSLKVLFPLVSFALPVPPCFSYNFLSPGHSRLTLCMGVCVMFFMYMC